MQPVFAAGAIETPLAAIVHPSAQRPGSII
jgi:hypothetical protein